VVTEVPRIDLVSRSRRNRFTSVRLNRLVEHRDDKAWIRATLENPHSRLVPLWRSRSLLARQNSEHWAVYLHPGDIDRTDVIQPPTLLGSDGVREYFAVSVTDVQRELILKMHPDAEFTSLRRASVNMAAKHAGILAYAKALHYWQHRHAFCGACGNPNLLLSAGHRLHCSHEECARDSFPRIDPAIIVLVTQGDACLLGRSPSWPAKQFSTLAGFVEPGESLEDAVVREVFEETSIELKSMRYVSSQPWPFPASSMCGFYAEAENRHFQLSDEIEELRWYNVESLDRAIMNKEVLLSPPVSIAFRLLADWYRQQGGGDLEALCQKQRTLLKKSC
jgi:NAD+ diphosphatase